MKSDIVKDSRILIDTSVWIDYFRNRHSRAADRVDEILSFYDVFVPDVVIAELIQGAKSEKEVSVIRDFTGAFNIIFQKRDTWFKAGMLSFSMKRKGVTVHLVDCYIAVLADENKCGVLTLDDHFKSIRKFIKIELPGI